MPFMKNRSRPGANKGSANRLEKLLVPATNAETDELFNVLNRHSCSGRLADRFRVPIDLLSRDDNAGIAGLSLANAVNYGFGIGHM